MELVAARETAAAKAGGMNTSAIVALCATTGCAVLAATSYVITPHFVIELLNEE